MSITSPALFRIFIDIYSLIQLTMSRIAAAKAYGQ